MDYVVSALDCVVLDVKNCYFSLSMDCVVSSLDCVVLDIQKNCAVLAHQWTLLFQLWTVLCLI